MPYKPNKHTHIDTSNTKFYMNLVYKKGVG